MNGSAYGAVQSTATKTIPASAFSDNNTITVRAFAGPGGTGCSSIADIVVRVNEVSGPNTIGSDQTVCVGETPDPFTNVATPTAPRTADGGTLTYQWQSRQLGERLTIF